MSRLSLIVFCVSSASFCLYPIFSISEIGLRFSNVTQSFVRVKISLSFISSASYSIYLSFSSLRNTPRYTDRVYLNLWTSVVNVISKDTGSALSSNANGTRFIALLTLSWRISESSSLIFPRRIIRLKHDNAFMIDVFPEALGP